MSRIILAGALLAVLTGCDATVALWRMDETSGTTMVDSSGRGHDGTLRDVVVGRPGQAGLSYQFNGTSSVAEVPHANDMNPGSADFTYSAWVKTTVLPPAGTSDIIRKGLSTTVGGDYKLELYPVNGSSARARCFIKGSSGSLTAGGGNYLHDGRWHQLVCSRTGDTLSLSIDGTTVKTSSGTVGSISNSSQLTIGAKPTGQDFYNGLIDDARVTING